MRDTLRNLRTSAFLFILPEVDTILDMIRKALAVLDRQAAILDKRVEDEVVHLAGLNTQRTAALKAVEAAYSRRAGASIERVSAIQERADQAAAARDRVADFLGA